MSVYPFSVIDLLYFADSDKMMMFENEIFLQYHAGSKINQYHSNLENAKSKTTYKRKRPVRMHTKTVPIQESRYRKTMKKCLYKKKTRFIRIYLGYY